MNTKQKLVTIWQKYRHALPLALYGIIYMLWFTHLEKTVTSHYRLIHFSPDDLIPFCEAFVIPYLLWFAYVAVVVIYFFFRDKDDYFRACTFLFTGMTVFLIVSIHVYNSLGCHIAVMKSARLEKKKGIRACSFVLCVSIILSTMFIKQHSVFDVTTAFIMAAVMYGIVYRSDVLLNFYHGLHRRRKRKPGTLV